MAFQLFAAAGLKILKERAMAAMWATDGRKHTYQALSKERLFLLASGLGLHVQVGCCSFGKCLPPTPSPGWPWGPTSRGMLAIDSTWFLLCCHNGIWGHTLPLPPYRKQVRWAERVQNPLPCSKSLIWEEQCSLCHPETINTECYCYGFSASRAFSWETKGKGPSRLGSVLPSYLKCKTLGQH